ncbi:MAG: VOC family protein, partial [Minwuiales bacterium]|nr:VOC family protein [Minwuiales bacterium]
ARRFLADWGLKKVKSSAQAAVFETLDGGEVLVRLKTAKALLPAIEPGPTLREVTWGVSGQRALDALLKRLGKSFDVTVRDDGSALLTDPMGMAVGLRVKRRRKVKAAGSPANTADRVQRIDKPARVYDRAEPVSIGHVVLNVPDLAEMEAFYTGHLGFQVSDRYPGRGVFLRCQKRGGHHNLFLLQLPTGKAGLNHVAFTVRDIHEVFGGGLHVSRAGWETQIGPGRHPISSAYFWYVKNPCGGLVEYYADEDYLTEKWRPRKFQPSPELFAEWAIDGGLDGMSRRQRVPKAS